MEGSFGTGPVGSRHEMCISCYKPETTSVMVVNGDVEWLAASLNHWARLPMDQAIATAEEIHRDNNMPEGRNTSLVRLCRSCANKTGVPVHHIDLIQDGAQVTAVIQPEGI
jgi:hypothetical protein